MGMNETLNDKQFSVLSKFIEEHCGIKMPPAKRIMLEARLRKRLKAISIDTFKEYIEFVFSAQGMNTELVHMVDSVTTNKTDFFREPQHFDYMVKQAIPELMERTSVGGAGSPLKIWSAGCSTGEEPYTLSIVLSEVARTLPGFDFKIHCTDISTAVLAKAKRGVYDIERISPIPMELRKRYLLKSKDRTSNLIRINSALRAKLAFRQLNFMDSDFGMRDMQDIIFCRNVFIYFDRQTQERIINTFCKSLKPGGFIFLGHSESINGLKVPLTQVAPSAYRGPG
jgi:chemotaxis protein methyltransferase CheR